MYMRKRIKCKMCKRKVDAVHAYRNWVNVECFESILFSIFWTKNWWLCTAFCSPQNRDHRFIEIDGYQYGFSKKWPFIKR